MQLILSAKSITGPGRIDGALGGYRVKNEH